jgi:hypothetical protein
MALYHCKQLYPQQMSVMWMDVPVGAQHGFFRVEAPRHLSNNPKTPHQTSAITNEQHRVQLIRNC